MRIKNLELRIKHKKLDSLFLSLNSSALTLIEVLVAMGIATVAGVLLLVIIVNSTGLFTQQSSKVQMGLNINDALSQVRSSIKDASIVADKYINGGTTYTTGSKQLVLKVLSIDSSGSIIDNTFDFFVFFQDQSYLRFKILPDPLSFRKAANQVFSSSVNNLIFQYFNSAIPPVEVTPTAATKVRITLTLKQKIGVKYETQTATSEANLRND